LAVLQWARANGCPEFEDAFVFFEDEEEEDDFE
jgi:hypothetical protein